MTHSSSTEGVTDKEVFVAGLCNAAVVVVGSGGGGGGGGGGSGDEGAGAAAGAASAAAGAAGEIDAAATSSTSSIAACLMSSTLRSARARIFRSRAAIANMTAAVSSSAPVGRIVASKAAHETRADVHRQRVI